jgi:transcriptional regulator with XRE-family HTH domain
MWDPLTEVVRRNVEVILSEMGRPQRDLAEYVGKSEAWLSRFLHGQRGVRIKDLEAVARFCGVSVSDLFLQDGYAHRERRRFERRTGVERRVGQDRRKAP